MKVILVANTGWYLYNFRLSLAKRLSQEGFEVVMVFPRDEYAEEIEAHGFRTVQWELERQTTAPWQELTSILALRRIYHQEKPGLVHHFTIKPVAYGSLASRLARIPATINSITGRGFVFLGSSPRAAYLRPLVKFLISLSYHNLNVATTFENQADLDYFVQAGMVPMRNVYLVNGVGVDTQVFDYQPEIHSEPPIIVFPGRLLWAKGVGTLVEAAKILKERHAVRIVLVGKPDPGNPESIEESIIQKWVAEGLVEWWGWQSDMRSVYQQCQIVVLPSMGEGLSKALLEAASCGRPIVATDVPGCKEVVIPGVTGYLVPTGEPHLLAERLGKLILDPELRAQMGNSGRRLIEENFSDETVNWQLLEIYRALLKA
ncbi:MAG: glycosyltransferase family 4 protein [Chloroflexota bacterium]